MKRTPKNFDGIESPARTIRDLLPEALMRLQKIGVAPGKDILKEWPAIIGAKGAKLTEAVSFIDGVLTVRVLSSTLYSLLCQHEKPQLLHKLQERFPNAQVRNIFFRIG